MSRWPLWLRVAFDAVAYAPPPAWIAQLDSLTAWCRPAVLLLASLALFPFAVGVLPNTETFPTLLDEHLDAPETAEVQNFGIVCTAPEDDLHLWRTEVQPYRPDLVSVCVFVGNDIRAPRESSLLNRGGLLAVAVTNRPWRLSHRPAPSSTLAPESASFDDASFRDIERERRPLCRRPADAKVERAWSLTLSILGRLADETEPGLRVAIIPDEDQANNERFSTLAAGHEGDDGREDSQRRLPAFCAGRSVRCPDLLPALRETQRKGLTNEPHDTHWNASGKRVAAEQIASRLERG